MLFLNRRGFAGFVSCRACGQVIKCPHCDVTLTYHRNGKLRCHYCGYEETFIKQCPICKSSHVAAFGLGTEKVEAALHAEFPTARVLRMDMDTTRRKHAHEEMLAAFSKGEADILLGTQMIVKGHDYANVTLVGILAADLPFMNRISEVERKHFSFSVRQQEGQEEETKEGMLSSRPIRRSIIQLQQQRSIRMRTFLRKSTLTVS